MINHIFHFQEETMEENKHRDLFCKQCLLQFGKKLVYDLHLSLVHGKKIEIKTEANTNFNESQVDEDISMTQLLTHSVAHSTKPSSWPKTNNQPLKKFLGLVYS